MKLRILAVGQIKRGPERDLVDDYVQRFRNTGRSLGFRGLEEVEIASGGGVEGEGERLAAKLPSGCVAIRLDERGPQHRSSDFAAMLAKHRDQGVQELCFLMGGADGYSDAVKSAVPETLSLSKATLPHRLARVILAEQLYRGAAILAGTPYHKD